MPRFVLLRHECPASLGKPSHWDLMLEHEEVLLTWSLERLPSQWISPTLSRRTVRFSDQSIEPPPASTPAAQLPNHRLAYLDYEGPLSNNRGHVTRHDSGSYDLIEVSPDRLICTLHGHTLAAQVTLSQISPDHWTLTSQTPPP